MEQKCEKFAKKKMQNNVGKQQGMPKIANCMKINSGHSTTQIDF